RSPRTREPATPAPAASAVTSSLRRVGPLEARFPCFAIPLAARTTRPWRRYAARLVSTASLWEHPDFLQLWVGQTVSKLGSVVTRTALPLVALLTLGPGPLQLAYVVIAQSMAVLLVGLVDGAWLHRLHRQHILIATDVIHARIHLDVPLEECFGVV